MTEPFETTAARRTGLVPVFLDTNVWDYLFDNGLTLHAELPRAAFSVNMTREQEMEYLAIPETKQDRRDFISHAMAARPVLVDTWFGWSVEDLPPDEHRSGGFGIGRWPTHAEVKFYNDLQQEIRATKKRSKLFANEGDVALASRSSHSLVLSLDAKRGPLTIAQEMGGNVCFMTGLTPAQTIGDFVSAYVSAKGLTF